MHHFKSLGVLIVTILLMTAVPAGAQDIEPVEPSTSQHVDLSDTELYRRALDSIEREQGLLPGGGGRHGGPTQVPSPGDGAAEMRSVDRDGALILQAFDARNLEVPESARRVLMMMPAPSTGELGPRPVAYEAARRELEQLVAADAMAAPVGERPIVTLVLLLVMATAIAVAAAIWVRGRKQRGLADLAMTDGLTGLKNRRRLEVDLAQQRRNGKDQTALLMIDIDHFKTFNDTYGHATGDEVLRQVGVAIASSVRADDVPYRYGGEEFCVLLPSSDDEAALVVAERVRKSVEAIDIGVSVVTASVGVASGEASAVDQIAAHADKALYSAKTAGRNQVVAASKL